MNRRGFLKSIAAIAISAGVGVRLVYEKAKTLSFSDIMRKTLSDPNMQEKMAANITANNALLRRMKGGTDS